MLVECVGACPEVFLHSVIAAPLHRFSTEPSDQDQSQKEASGQAVAGCCYSNVSLLYGHVVLQTVNPASDWSSFFSGLSPVGSPTTDHSEVKGQMLDGCFRTPRIRGVCL